MGRGAVITFVHFGPLDPGWNPRQGPYAVMGACVRVIEEAIDHDG